jgi:hypothetical protein
MEINRILAQLYAERDRVQRAITMLERLLPDGSRQHPHAAAVVASRWAWKNARQ